VINSTELTADEKKLLFKAIQYGIYPEERARLNDIKLKKIIPFPTRILEQIHECNANIHESCYSTNDSITYFEKLCDLSENTDDSNIDEQLEAILKPKFIFQDFEHLITSLLIKADNPDFKGNPEILKRKIDYIIEKINPKNPNSIKVIWLFPDTLEPMIYINKFTFDCNNKNLHKIKLYLYTDAISPKHQNLIDNGQSILAISKIENTEQKKMEQKHTKAQKSYNFNLIVMLNYLTLMKNMAKSLFSYEVTDSKKLK